TFHDVSFTHNAKLILDNFNLTLHKGQTLAIVGPSGVGKSTIVSLIARFYDATQGVITIDGIPLQRCSTVSLRKLMGIVTQQPILFNDTIYNNIALGRSEANWEHVIAAATTAHAHTFISELPQGYQTYVGERGAKLSGGQVQRIAIARAVLCNPPILILDEATAALDSACEQAVQAALDKYRQDKTVLMIAHRLSTVQHADEILVIEEGSVVARGTHEVLLQQSGLYKSLQQIQTAI
ncbi:MAG: ATP-binding cassette domain-containing protein, partial [Bacteroidota bacterium]